MSRSPLTGWVNNNFPYHTGDPSSTVIAGGGGGSFGVLQYRTSLDARRAAQGETPESQYPDGYLGTIINRREDKLMQAVKSRLTDRSYQRGVHKGDKIDPRDYYWGDSFYPAKGIEYQAQGRKWTASGSIPEHLAHMGKVDFQNSSDRNTLYGQFGVSGSMRDIVGVEDPIRRSRMERLLPSWR